MYFRMKRCKNLQRIADFTLAIEVIHLLARLLSRYLLLLHLGQQDLKFELVNFLRKKIELAMKILKIHKFFVVTNNL